MSQKLKEAVDRMVEEAIRRILPEVMNEVLVRTIANSGVIQEARMGLAAPAKRTAGQQRAIQQQPRKPAPVRGSLRDVLGESSDYGADFYDDPRKAFQAREEEPQADDEEMHDDVQPLERRIQALPPQLQAMAEGINIDDDDGGSWDDESGFSPAVAGPPLDRAAKAVGIDFKHMGRLLEKVDKKRMSPDDVVREREFQQLALQRKRDQLNRKA